MKTKILLLGILFFTLSVYAQTEREGVGLGAGGNIRETTPVTLPQLLEQQREQKIRYFNGHFLRKVNGKIYNGMSFEMFSGDVYSEENGVLILYNKWRAQKYVAVTNFPGTPLSDQTITIIAMQLGTYDMAGSPIALYDCGTLYTPPPPTPEQIKTEQNTARIAALHEKQKQSLIESNAVVWLQSQATNGDASAQCSLGEHYLVGLGCETNRRLAIQWLQKSAAQGNIEASNKLAALNFPSLIP